MKLVKTTFAIILATFLSISCSQSSLGIDETSLTNTDEISKDELSTALKTVIVNYPVTAVNDDESTEEINSDEQLGKIISRNTRPKIEFPFDVIIDGETFTIEGVHHLRELLKRPKKNRPPFKLVFPVTVINADDTTTEIVDQEALKAYHETLEQGVRPTFQFPISIEDKEGNIIEMADEDALKTYMEDNKPENKGGDDRPDNKRPPFKLVFPVTVINADDTTTEIVNQEALKAYHETLEQGVRPTFQFPISIEDKEGNIIEMADEDALKNYMEANKPENKGGDDRPDNKRPPFKLVFPVTVINADDTTTEIADQEALKAYHETLEQVVRPTFQFPISIEDKEGNIIEMADEDALKTYMEANKPERKNR